MKDVTLRGMTWDHPRGYDPLVACSALWRERTGVAVAWERRSLQDFESYPVADLAARYDLIVIDHPHVGQIVGEQCLLPIDQPGREAALADFAAHSVGPSFRSYLWQGRHWALPVDAATQVQAWRPDLIDAPAKRWDEVIDLARRGLVTCPIRPPHSLMCVMTLAANLGRPCATERGPLLDRQTFRTVWDMLRALDAHLDPATHGMDPIAVLEAMAAPDGRAAIAPLTYGYVSYAIAGFRPRRVHFADIPAAGSAGPIGSTLGGTGMAISARTAHPEAALDFAYWVCSADVQRGPYVAAGGQPGHSMAWEDDAANALTADFYRGTRATLEGANLRARHDGYMGFQHRSSIRIVEALEAKEGADTLGDDLDRMFAGSFR